MTKPLKAAQFSINPETGSVTATIGDAKVEVSSNGKTVAAYSKNGITQEIAAAAPVSKEGAKISVNKDFNMAVVNGVTFKQAPDGSLVIAAAAGTIIINKSTPANDAVVIKKPDAAKKAYALGEKTAEGVYAGLTPDGNTKSSRR